MNMPELLMNILSYLVPPLIVFLTAFYLIRTYMKRDYEKLLAEKQKATQQVTLPLRLQAYERMTLFLERLSPNNLFIRVRKTGMNVSDFQNALLADIRAEYDHNLSQQVYISPELWNQIRATKEEMIKIINSAAETLRPTVNAIELSKVVFEMIIKNNEIPTQKTLDVLKREAQKIL